MQPIRYAVETLLSVDAMSLMLLVPSRRAKLCIILAELSGTKVLAPATPCSVPPPASVKVTVGVPALGPRFATSVFVKSPSPKAPFTRESCAVLSPGKMNSRLTVAASSLLPAGHATIFPVIFLY